MGGLTPEGRARVKDLTAAAEARGDREEAVRLALDAAEDAPAYAAAWAVYQRTPAREAEDVLDDILEARRKHAESAP